MYGSFHFSCDVCSDTQMSETVASHFGWCSSQMMRVLLPANHLAEGSIISLSVNHSSRSRWCRMSVRGGEADTRWLCVQIWHIPPCSLAFRWVHLVGKASGRQRNVPVCYSVHGDVLQRQWLFWSRHIKQTNVNGKAAHSNAACWRKLFINLWLSGLMLTMDSDSAPTVSLGVKVFSRLRSILSHYVIQP